MTYTGSNEGYVGKRLKMYFQEAGIQLKDDEFDRVVRAVIESEDFHNMNTTNNNDYIVQKGLNALRQMKADSRSNVLS